jgi:hypothetical protein
LISIDGNSTRIRVFNDGYNPLKTKFGNIEPSNVDVCGHMFSEESFSIGVLGLNM